LCRSARYTGVNANKLLYLIMAFMTFMPHPMPDNKVSLNVQLSISGATCCNAVANLPLECQVSIGRWACTSASFLSRTKILGKSEVRWIWWPSNCSLHKRFMWWKFAILARNGTVISISLITCFASVTNNLIPSKINAECLPVSVVILH
jgi:hypothetical protein